jgi:hypothetical protein
MGEDQLLKTVNLIEKTTELADCFKSLVGITMLLAIQKTGLTPQP